MDTDPLPTPGRLLRELCADVKWTVSQLANDAGIERQTAAKASKGAGMQGVSQLTRDKIADALERRFDEVVRQGEHTKYYVDTQCRPKLEAYRRAQSRPLTPHSSQSDVTDNQALPSTLDPTDEDSAHAAHLLVYLDALADHLAALPPGFPPGTTFDGIRQSVVVRRERRPFRPAHPDRTRGRAAASWDQFFGARADGRDDPRYLPHGAAGDGDDSREVTVQAWDEVRANLRRAVILGDPGYGKSWLLRHEARRVARAEAEALGQGARRADDVRLPVYLHLGTLAREVDAHKADGDPFAALVRALHAASPAPLAPDFTDWIGRHLQAGGGLLLLDALDEVEQPSYAPLRDALALLATRAPNNHIWLTSRPVGYAAPPFPLRDPAHDAEIELVAFAPGQVVTFIDAWFPPPSPRGQRLRAALARTLPLRGLARVPLLLRFLCQLAMDPDPGDPHAPLPARRVEVYEQLLHHLLRADWRDPGVPHPSATRVADKIIVLRGLAWHFATGPTGWRDLLPLDELTRTLRAILGRDPLLREDLRVGPHEGDLLRELSEGDGLLVAAGAPASGRVPTTVPYTFLHRTIHEYLAMDHLAARAGMGAPWLEEVRPHLWFDPDWHEIIPLLAGRLADPTPLLTALLDEPDDCFHAMLLLAARCAGAARPDALDPRVAARIAHGLRTLLRSRSDAERADALRAFGHLARAAGTALPALVEAMRDPNRVVREAAAAALGDSDDPTALDALLRVAGDPDADFWVRLKAARELWRGGDARALDALSRLHARSRQEIMNLMWRGDAHALDVRRSYGASDLGTLVRLATLHTLGKIDDASPLRGVVELGGSGDARALDALLHLADGPDADTSVRYGTLVDALLHLADDADVFMRESAVGALAILCNNAENDQLLRICEHLMRYGQREMHTEFGRTAAYEALRSLAPRLRVVTEDEWPSWRSRLMAPTRAMLEGRT